MTDEEKYVHTLLLAVAKAANNYVNPSAYEEEVIGIDAALDALRAVMPEFDAKE